MVTAVDRYQTICYPMVHRIWKPANSHRKIGLAWVIALVFCVPQAFVFGGQQQQQQADADDGSTKGELKCVAHLGPQEGKP